MKNGKWKSAVGAGVLVLLSGSVDAASVEERLAALEAKFEQEASVREESLISRIRELEGQVSILSKQVVVSIPASGSGGGVEVLTRINSLEQQVGSLEESRMNNPLKDVHLGGYGELHYNALAGSGGAKDKREVDFHRFVLTVGKDFSERARFFSEFELEHAIAGEGQAGEIELEQAFIDYDLSDRHTARAGVFLLPVGLLNETHEPTRFYGVERNPIEKDILPTTWWEAGVGLYGQLSDTLSYAAYLHSGLAAETNSYSVRGGRQKVGKANASDPAMTVALSYIVPGITIGGSVNVQTDITQGAGGAEPSEAWMGEAHVDLKRGRWGLRALYAQWNLGGDGPAAIGADRQMGWYIEPSYQITDTLGVFARYNQWDNRARGGSNSGKEQIDLGVNWYPHEQVVLKADYQWQSNEDGKNQNGINLGVGYDF